MGDLQEYERVPLIEMRERIISQLKLNFAHDNLNEAEFERRVEIAHAATSKLELVEVVSGLPRYDESSGIPAERNSVVTNQGRVEESDTMVAIFSGVDRKGVWRPARHTTMVAIMGGLELDYTEAEFPPGVTEIKIFACMGGCELTVPPDLTVEVKAIPIFGGVDNRSKGTGADPTLRITAVAVMGGVEIKTSSRKN